MRSLSKWTVAAATMLFAVAVPHMAAAGPDAPPAPLRDGLPPALMGLIYKDPATNVIIYVETDGRHVAAISPDGKLLWRKNPFVDAGMQPYRLARPTINYVGPGRAPAADAGGVMVSIGFNSSQSGEMDIATGHFRFEGQD
jgi:hypothetical protein